MTIVCVHIKCDHPRDRCTRCKALECVHTLDPRSGQCIPCGVPRPRASNA